MPGYFGTSGTDDGMVASTSSSANAGAFARNDGPDPPPPGTPGGAGIFGLTVVPGGAGVFGANNHASTGRGVQGNGPEAGVSGFSENGSGLLGHSNQGDGTQSFAHSSDHNALLASNDATGTAPAGGAPAGGGVLGVTTVGGAAGVFGANNHYLTGRGVQGNGPEAGVSGFSENGSGLLGQSNHGDGLQAFAHDEAQNGVLGHNNASAQAPLGGPPAGNGVFGFSEVPNGSGVCGAIAQENTQGAGVTGIGPTAGRFFGDVLVSGELNVGGVLISDLLRRINELEEKVAVLRNQVPNVDPRPSLSVTREGSGAQSVFVLTGSRFHRNTTVTIRVGDGPIGEWEKVIYFAFPYRSDPDGALTGRLRFACKKSYELTFLATDGRPAANPTGKLWSNQVKIICPYTS